MNQGHDEHERDGERGNGQPHYYPPDRGLGKGPPGPPIHPAQTQPLFHQSSVPTNRAEPRRVDHTYRDYSKYPLSELPPVKKAPTNFPSKLHQILSDPEYSYIISWMPHGRAWKIHNKDLLIQEVVPKFFVQSKYESFTRQLNGWGFKRLHQSGNDFNAYYHECFLRGLPYLTVLMKRVPPNKGKQLPHVEGEPNFYEIEKEFPLPPDTPMMPYPGHHLYPQSHLTSAAMYGVPPPQMASAAMYGAPPEPGRGAPMASGSEVGYGHHYSPYRSNYLPPYYSHQDDTQVASAYASHPGGYRPYPPYPTQYSNPPPEYYPHYPYPPAPPYGSPSYYNNNVRNNTGPVKSEEGPFKSEDFSSDPTPHGAVQEESRAPFRDEEKEASLGSAPMSSPNQKMPHHSESSENDLVKE